jgi:O-antigen/teichoic acid export membrane protein
MTLRPLASRRTLAINTVSSVATRVLQLTVLVWVNQYLLRHIAPAEYALLPLVMSLLVFGELFRALFAGALGRYIVEADARGDDDGVTRIVSSMLPALAGAAALLALLTVAAIWKIDVLLALEPDQIGNARLMLGLLMGSLCLDLITAPYGQGLYARQRFVLLNGIELAGEVLRASLVFGLLLGLYPSVIWLTIGSTAAGLATLAARIWFTRRLMPAIRWQSGLFCRHTARRLLGFGAWTSVQGLTNLISTTAPALILNRAAAPLDVASFHLGRLPDLQLRRVASAAAIPLQPALTSLQAVRGEAARHELYYRGGRYHLWIILLGAVPLVMFADAIILRYAGAGYAMAAQVLVPLLAVYPLTWASAMFYRIAHAVGRVGAYYVCDLVVQGCTLLALLYLVVGRGLGAPGAALAIAGTTAVLHVVLVWPMGLRLIGGQWTRFWRETLWPGLLPAAAAAGTAWGFRSLVPLETWPRIGAGSVLAGSVYLAVLLAVCLAPPDRDLVQRALKRLRLSRSWPGTSAAVRQAAP